MKLAIMQPYIFPYVGYFQLIAAVDTFVFYDDVNFIKRGWINRNKLLVNNEEIFFSVPLVKASQNKLINEIEVQVDGKWLLKFYKTIEQNYAKAPYFESVFQLIKKVFSSEYNTISQLAIKSIEHVCDYIDMNKEFEVSSQIYPETIGKSKADRLISITKKKGYSDYINPIGGKELYDKQYFKAKDIKLSFIENELVPYRQFTNTFVSGLSIIDVLMFNSKDETKALLQPYIIK